MVQFVLHLQKSNLVHEPQCQKFDFKWNHADSKNKKLIIGEPTDTSISSIESATAMETDVEVDTQKLHQAWGLEIEGE
jgi:hypothetical protein